MTEVGVNQKLLPMFKGPFVVTQVLPGDRYVVESIPGSDLTRRHFRSVYAAFNMKRCDLKQSESIGSSGTAELS